MSHVLEVQSVSKRFGGLEALHDVSLWADGEILGLIGPNGAGKTTLFNVVSGFLEPTSGQVRFRERAIQDKPAHEVVAMGIARTFQIVKPFAELTVLDNVLSGHGMPRYSSPRAFRERVHTPDNEAVARRILERTGLTRWADTPAGSLPIGLQRRLEIARALATEPDLLLLDEPAAGLTRQEADALADLIRELHAEGISLIVIEHNMHFAMNLCQRIAVLAQGEVIAEGEPAEVQNNEAVINAYLGKQGTNEVVTMGPGS